MRPIMGGLSDYTDVAPGSRAIIFMVNKSRRLFLPTFAKHANFVAMGTWTRGIIHAGGAGEQIQCGSRERLRFREHVNNLVGHAVHDQHLILHLHVHVVTQFRYLRQDWCW